MIALRFQRSVPRYLASRALSRRAPGVVASHVAPLRLGHYDDPDLPGAGWAPVAPRLAGICGSDLAMIAGEASFYFSPITSLPFVPGHEVTATLLADCDGLGEGTRVVVEPVIACAARGFSDPCPACAAGDIGLCERTALGHVSPGLQTGFCEDTAGGWGTVMVAHSSQLHPVPDELTDEEAVLVEPLACAVHAVLRAGLRGDETVLVQGAGTMGLLTLAACRAMHSGVRIVAAAKHPRQRREAERLGADVIARPADVIRTVRLETRAILHEPERGQPWLTGGVDASFECTGNASAFETCLRATRARGTVVLVGLPGPSRIDLAPVWHRELDIKGAYTYGVEELSSDVAQSLGISPGRIRTFDLAIALVRRLELGRLVSAAYPLSRYAEAIDHAMDAGRLDSVKVVFDVTR